MAKTKEKKRLKKKLLHKYRLVILNEDTFEERVSFKLNRLNVFILFGFSAIALIALTTVLIAYTPLREYIPGYSSTKLQKQATELIEDTDSLPVCCKCVIHLLRTEGASRGLRPPHALILRRVLYFCSFTTRFQGSTHVSLFC